MRFTALLSMFKVMGYYSGDDRALSLVQMFKIRKDKFILLGVFALAINQAVNAGVNSFYGYYSPDYLINCYSYVVLLAMLFYVQAIGHKFPYSFDRMMFFCAFYVFLVPYVLIRQKKFLWGLVHIVLWFVLLTIGFWSSLSVELLVGDTYHYWKELE